MDLFGCWSHLWSLTQQSWSSMAARRSVPTIGGRLATNRPCWADLADSSQDCSKDATPLPLVDDSYDTPATGVNSKGGLNSMLSRTVLKGPIDFTFLLNNNDKSVSASQSSAGSTSPSLQDSASATSSSMPSLNPSATAFVPMTLRAQPSSPGMMPPPAVPQATAKSRRIRGKRALSTQLSQAPAVKRPKEQARERLGSDPATQAATPQNRANLPSEPPPPATEEEWQHRIAKRVKVVTSMKETREYQGYTSLRPLGERLDGEPRTPVAEDRSLSKRRWEYEIQQWRTQLKQWAADQFLPEEAEAMQLDEAAGISTPSPE